MKFTAIIITKKKILTAAAVLFTAAVTAVGIIIAGNNKVTETFNEREIYESAISEGLPNGEEKEVKIKDILKKLAGFDWDEPQSIAKQGLPGGEVQNIAESTAMPDEEQPAAEPEQTPPPEETPAPVREEKKELPSHEKICSASGLKINNATDYAVNPDEACSGTLPFKTETDAPQVLVVHTHTTECYSGDEMSGETERTTDNARNVVAVGNVICGKLEEYGIKTVHDTTVHDYPSYQGAYTRTLKTIESNLKKYPSIKAVFDVHRDAFVYSDGSKLKVSYNRDGQETAKVMLVVGTDSMGLAHPGWRNNFMLAAKIQNAAEIMYPGLVRPIDLRRERFNMHMTSGSLLLEVGSNGNSLAEALEGGAEIGEAIAAALLNG